MQEIEYDLLDLFGVDSARELRDGVVSLDFDFVDARSGVYFEEADTIFDHFDDCGGLAIQRYLSRPRQH